MPHIFDTATLSRASALTRSRVFVKPDQFIGMFAVTAQTAPGIVAVGRVGANRNSRGAARGVVSVPDVGGFHASRSRVALGGAQRRGEAMRMVRTAATEGEAEMGGVGEVFPRVKERDPYRRLGIDSEASYEEVQDARNYLVETYRSHTAGVEAIEAAFDKIIQQKLSMRKKAKGMKAAMRKKKEGEDYVPPFLERLQAQFARPDDQTIFRRAALFAILIGWAIATSAQSGPAFQLFVGFGCCVYFLNLKRGGDRNALGRDFINSFVALVLGALVGSVFPVYIPIFPASFSPELILSLFSFVAFFIFATFLK